jgi:glycosyltransferase involved in cell wall biosynthesis
LEAVAMSKSIVNKCHDCKEVLDNGINGSLCEVRNAKDLADKMVMMINLSEDEGKAMGKAGREKNLMRR